MRRLLVVAASLVLLAGCASDGSVGGSPPANPGQPPADDLIFVVDVKVKDRTVTCVMWDGNDGSSTPSGMDCDWANAK